MSKTPSVIDWLPYQRAWIEDRARFKIGMFTRRGGKTFGSSGEIVDECIRAEMERRRVRWTILSRSDNTAKEALEDALKPITRAFWAVYNEVSKLGGEPEFGEDTFYSRELDATYKTHEVRFPGGSRVVAISASPDAARGFGGNLLLDEFAFHQDSRRIWASAFPVAARGGHKIRVISTPNGKGNKFYELMTTEDNGWSKHHVDIYEAVRQGLDVDIEQLRAGMADEDAWAQEFELKWLDEASSWLSYDLIGECEREGLGAPRRYLGGPCFVGIDIAARNDLFVIWVLEKVGTKLLTREVIAKRRITFAEQDMLLDDVMRRYHVVRVRMDQTGMGEKPVEDAKRRHGQERVEGILFTATAKLDMATGMKERMQDRELLLPLGDPEIRSDLHAVKSRVGPTGARRLIADDSSDGHADRFWALALASSAAELDYQPYAYQPVRMGQDMDRDIAVTGGFRTREGVW
ncbi:Mu-like prophage FluMu protein gp28 [Roseivivax halotolerans]|uniref:Mu-like prophage FluMu protein gp28 n=1 Tax=Roseivivax halotolerans TaxID=93684 RepID=A0A1I5W394_9RHOB|nr:terminase family protein [Roseivivax halotolerans]SFQ14208.1 Mu-like prophage FluMu protein gp28 [Roseivivax halotolerans]